jgi:hypothetical protein
LKIEKVYFEKLKYVFLKTCKLEIYKTIAWKWSAGEAVIFVQWGWSWWRVREDPDFLVVQIRYKECQEHELPTVSLRWKPESGAWKSNQFWHDYPPELRRPAEE